MSKTFTDDNLMLWEAYPSGGDFGFSADPYIIFNCLSNRLVRPRMVSQSGDEADAERLVFQASTSELAALFRSSRDIP